MRRVTDEDIQGTVLELAAESIANASISCPADPGKTLGARAVDGGGGGSGGAEERLQGRGRAEFKLHAGRRWAEQTAAAGSTHTQPNPLKRSKQPNPAQASSCRTSRLS